MVRERIIFDTKLNKDQIKKQLLKFYKEYCFYPTKFKKEEVMRLHNSYSYIKVYIIDSRVEIEIINAPYGKEVSSKKASVMGMATESMNDILKQILLRLEKLLKEEVSLNNVSKENESQKEIIENSFSTIGLTQIRLSRILLAIALALYILFNGILAKVFQSVFILLSLLLSIRMLAKKNISKTVKFITIINIVLDIFFLLIIFGLKL